MTCLFASPSPNHASLQERQKRSQNGLTIFLPLSPNHASSQKRQTERQNASLLGGEANLPLVEAEGSGKAKLVQGNYPLL